MTTALSPAPLPEMMKRDSSVETVTQQPGRSDVLLSPRGQPVPQPRWVLADELLLQTGRVMPAPRGRAQLAQALGEGLLTAHR